MIDALPRFARFVAVGAVATTLHYLILAALVALGIEPVAASSSGYVASSAFNYVINRTVTFRSRRSHVSTMFRFAAVTASGFTLNALSVWYFISQAGLSILTAQAIATLGTLVWNFSLHLKWTFVEMRCSTTRPI